jgi:hypothetical protein
LKIVHISNFVFNLKIIYISIFCSNLKLFIFRILFKLKKKGNTVNLMGRSPTGHPLRAGYVVPHSRAANRRRIGGPAARCGGDASEDDGGVQIGPCKSISFLL